MPRASFLEPINSQAFWFNVLINRFRPRLVREGDQSRGYRAL